MVDGSNLERNLYLTTHLLDLEINLIIALNMMDEVEQKGMKIDFHHLQDLLGAHIIPTSAVKKIGIESLLDHVVRIHTKAITIPQNKLSYRDKLEEKIQKISFLLKDQKEILQNYSARWLAIKLLENDKLVYQFLKNEPIWLKIEPILHETMQECELAYHTDSELAITEDRDAFIRGALQETVTYPHKAKKTLTDYLDSILINRILGLPIFFFIMWLIFQFTFRLGEAPIHWLETGFDYLATVGRLYISQELAQSILIDGILAGVGGVLVFLPNIILLFIALAFLEGTGYMARAAFVVDKVMHMVGLHGKSFIPMMTGFGCSVPAIMATRTIKNKADRLVTMMIIPFMSCGAKLPIYVLLISAFFPASMAGNIIFAIYLFGVAIAFLSARLLKSALFNRETEPFVMELPPYRMPSLYLIFMQAKIKTLFYFKKAGTIILAASLLIWFLCHFPQNQIQLSEYRHQMDQIQINLQLDSHQKEAQIQAIKNNMNAFQLRSSFAGRIGQVIEPVIKPLGFNWQVGIALISGLAGKELIVSTLATIYSNHQQSINLVAALRADTQFNPAVALSLITFILLYIPCFATIAVFYTESNSKKFVMIYAAYALFVAWAFSFFVYQVGLLFR